MTMNAAAASRRVVTVEQQTRAVIAQQVGE
jgi:hypothetical protein